MTVIPDSDTVFSNCRNGRYKRVMEALDAGFDIESTDIYGNTLLLIASQNINTRLVELLLEHGANINHQNVRVVCVCY